MFKVKTRSQLKKTQKKRFQIALIRKVGAGFEVTNGSVTFSGPNRAELLEALDRWEMEYHLADLLARTKPVAKGSPRPRKKKKRPKKSPAKKSRS